jgi:glyoxylate reductase
MSESRSRIFVSRSLSGIAASDPLLRLREISEVDVWSGSKPPEPEELAARTASAHGLLCLLTDRIDEDFLQSCPQLRVISSMSVGLDHIDLEAAHRRGIRVGHTPGVLTETTADLSFGLMLAAARRIPEADRFVRDGQWTFARRWDPDLLLGRDVHGAVLGVIGLGAIGRAVAARARGFGMQVLAWNRSGRSHPGVERVALDELLRRSDFVSIHVARTPETLGLLGPDEIAACKPGAVLVNAARGGIVDEDALAKALASGHLFAAALDVFAEEPLDPMSPLRRAPNLVLAPHIGSASMATRLRMAALAVENLIAGLQGDPMPHQAR